MRITQTLLLAITLLALSCTAQKKYELVLNIEDNASTAGQLDSTIAVIKKRLQPFDKGNNTITVSPDKKSITLLTACSEQDFIHIGLIKKGKLEFFECFTLENTELVEALTNTDKAISMAIEQGIPAVNGVNNNVFAKEYPLLKILTPQQPYHNSNETTYYTAHIGIVADSAIPLLEKCLTLLYKQLPNCNAYFKKIDNSKVKASEVYLVKNDVSMFNAGRYIAQAKADKDYTNRPVVNMEFNQAGALLWTKMTSKNVGKPIAMTMDGKVLSAPIVNSPITGGSTQISGAFTAKEVKELVASLNSGYLPLSLQIASINVAKQQ